MKSDFSIKEDVLAELSWQPNIDETQIGVIVQNGVVTLSGIVDTYSKKRTVENAVKGVSGVKAIAEEITIKYGMQHKKTDAEIAKIAIDALTWNSSVPQNEIEIKVENGWVYLSGEVEWDYQKTSAKNAIEDLNGIHGVTNSISIKPIVKPIEIKDKIKKAFERLADLESKNITVEVDGHTVKLKGKVHSISERDEAKKTAYYAPGVYEVKNELEIA
ncbi:BON domain-containing protein [Winogradskyella ludwigii]|jgi:osmotically-inducible protein OsmY|uniref:BON domain-containing protein n=1 Tax=Winogradskyella ludwigii TaxID=2686076 RepID=UPI0015CAD931|nr:BON domain-containing protein [Winogradskyella ludwigii]